MADLRAGVPLAMIPLIGADWTDACAARGRERLLIPRAAFRSRFAPAAERVVHFQSRVSTGVQIYVIALVLASILLVPFLGDDHRLGVSRLCTASRRAEGYRVQRSCPDDHQGARIS